MSRRRPLRDPLGSPPPGLRAGPQLASQVGDGIEAFLVSGGFVYYPQVFDGGEGSLIGAESGGYQLVAHVYVPARKIGFLKQLRCAPFMPSVFAQPFQAGGIANGNASWFSDELGTPYAAGQNGVWTTPFGWEAYFDPTISPINPPRWSWSLRMVQGDVDLQRANPNGGLAPFVATDPMTWYLWPSIPVPLTAYPQGLPGASVGIRYSEQRMQVVQSDELTCHVVIPGDTTLCLFTRWQQEPIQPRGYDVNGPVTYYDLDVYPLGPSFGQLSGYMQSVDSLAEPAAALINTRHGWGG